MNDQQPERESIWSIGRKWLPWYLAIIFVLTIGWTAFTAWYELTQGERAGIAEIANVVVKGTAPAAPLIPIYALFLVTMLDVAGGVSVVTARYLGDKFLKPLIEKRKEEGRQQGLEEGREKGLEEGREEERLRWIGWNRRREEAERNDEPFDEPPPGN